MQNELCPSCGEFVSSLDEVSGFCDNCNYMKKIPWSPPTSGSNVELWLSRHAPQIEGLMLADNLPARAAIKQIALNNRAYCQVCGDYIPHGTKGRHMICMKKPNCKKANRYYKYLAHEKDYDKQDALEKTLAKFKT